MRSFFSYFILRVNESDEKWGVTMYPCLECFYKGIPHRLHYVWEVLLFGMILPLFGMLLFSVPRTGSKTPLVGDCCSSWWL